MLICFHLTLGFQQASPEERIIRGGLTSHTAPLRRGVGSGSPERRSPNGAREPGLWPWRLRWLEGAGLCCSQMGSLFPRQVLLLAQEALSTRGTFWGSQPCYFYTLDFQALLPEQNYKQQRATERTSILKGHLWLSVPTAEPSCHPGTVPSRRCSDDRSESVLGARSCREGKRDKGSWSLQHARGF